MKFEKNYYYHAFPTLHLAKPEKMGRPGLGVANITVRPFVGFKNFQVLAVAFHGALPGPGPGNMPPPAALLSRRY